MFWTRPQPAPSNALDALFPVPEPDRHALVERMVATGEWLQADADEAVRLARRLETFVQEAKLAFAPQPDLVPAAAGAEHEAVRRRPRARRRTN